MKPPVLTIVTPTYNAASYLNRYFTSLEKQTIDPEFVEILIVDGGSSDETLAIAKKHHVRIVHNPKKLAEPGVALGFEEARSELIMILAVDNIFKDSFALEKIAGIFKDSSITAAFPKHDTAPEDSLYSRYFNTFTDPYTHFVYGAASNARTFSSLYKTIIHTDIYDVYDYKSAKSYPLIALAQGFTIRKNAITKRIDDRFDDVLTVYSLIEHGKRIAYVYGVSLYHYTVADFSDFVKKQKRAVENALVRGNSGISQRDKYLTGWQKMKRYLYFPYALTIVLPLLVSVIQAIRTGERVWLWHWYMSFISAIILLFTIAVIYTR